MIHDVVSAVYVGPYTLEIEFDDGTRGSVDFSKYLNRRGVFARFRDPAFFRSFTMNEDLGTLTWGDEIDVAPETLYAEATGTGPPAWTEPDEDEQSDRQAHFEPSPEAYR
ncbi:MAG: DUF2442 domain-containing protein [Pseudomonadota bacterium]